MAFKRKLISTSTYKGKTINVRFVGPDLMCDINGKELPNFYLSAEGARRAGERYINEIEKVAAGAS